MTYSNFRLDTLKKSFGLIIKQQRLFEKVEPVEATLWLKEALDKGRKLALVSEKARSELIVMPVLLTARELCNDSFYIYSGVKLDVDPDKGLMGECDFILTYTPPSPMIQSPIVTIVEAKKNDIEEGLGQCAAQMLGARLFNQQENSGIETIFGCVTTGEVWQFMKLENNALFIDSDRYYLNQINEILGIFQDIINYYKAALKV